METNLLQKLSFKNLDDWEDDLLRRYPDPKTIASNKELLANRLAPCKPVLEHSPQAYKFFIELCPHSSVFIPPQL